MEPQPLPSPQDQQPAPLLPISEPLNQVAQPLPNSNLRTLLSAIVLVVIGAIGAYFLITRSNPIPLTQTPSFSTSTTEVVATDQLEQAGNDTQRIKNITIRDVKNSFLSMPYLGNSIYTITEKSGYLLLKDGSATFSYCEVGQPCDSNETKNATVTLSTITPQKDSTLLDQGDWGGNDGAMILTFDFGNSQKEYYLGLFAINNNGTEKQNYLYFPPIKNLGRLSGEIENIDISVRGEVSVNIKTPTEVLRRTFLMMEGKRFYDLTEVTADRSQKIYNDEKLGYSFTYPQVIYMTLQGQSERATALETTLKTSPIYYAQECGLQPTFADSMALFWATYASGTVSLSAKVTVHKIDATSSVYLTSSLYGYDPADWDKIKQKVSIQDYVNSINNGTSIPGRKTTLETIQGYTVRHITPFSIGRPCENQTREQYQWIKNNLLFSLMFTESKTQPSSVQQKTELLNSILSSLKLK